MQQQLFFGGSYNPAGGFENFTAKFTAQCDDDCSVEYCLGTYTNTIFYHPPGFCSGTGIGVSPMSPKEIVVRRIADPDEYTGSGSRMLDRAYSCDLIEVIVHGKAFQSGGANTEQIFLNLSYNSALGGTNSLFTVESAQYDRTNTNWDYAANAVNELNGTTIQPFFNSGFWNINAGLPGGCNSSESATYMSNSWDFYVRLVLKVNDNIPITSNNGIIILQDIRADMRVRKNCNNQNEITRSCDTYSGSLMILAHQYLATTDFLPHDADADICTQRLRLRVRALGGLPSGEEMPNEIRPLIMFPDDITLSGLGSIMSLISSNPIKYFDTYQQTTPTAICSGCYSTGSGSVTITELTSGGGWPVFGKNGAYEQNIIATFRKKDCAQNPLTTELDFNYWTRGQMGAACLSPTAHFSTGNRPHTYPVTRSTNNNIKLLTSNGANYLQNSVIIPTGTTFNIPSELIYTGSPKGAPYTWIYPVTIPAQTSSLKIGGASLSTNSYYSSGAVWLPPGTSSFNLETQLRTSGSNNICSGGEYTIKLISGYTCNPATSGAPVPNPSNVPPASNTNNTCGFNTSEIKIKVVQPQISTNCGDCSGGTLKGTVCTTYVHSFKMTADKAPLHSPAAKFTMPAADVQLNALTVELNCGATNVSANLSIPSPVTGTYTVSALTLQGILNTNLGINYLPENCSFKFTATFEAINGSTSGTKKIIFEPSGRNLCNSIITPKVTKVEKQIQFFKLSLSPLAIKCNTIKATVTSTTGNYSYTWSGPGGFSASATGSSDKTNTVSVTNAGTYYVTVTDGCQIRTGSVYFAGSGSSLSFSKSVIQHVSPCFGGNNGQITIYNISGGPGSTNYTVSIKKTTGGPTYTAGTFAPDYWVIFSGLTAGTYNITVTDANNCTATSSIQVNQPAQLKVTKTVTDDFCLNAGGSINLTVTGGTGSKTYSWKKDNVAYATTQNISGLSAGTYTVTVTDANGCTATTTPTIISECGYPNGYTVNTNTTWTGANFSFCDDLIIKSGKILLLVNTTLRFAQYDQDENFVKVIVEPGGQLIMSNSTLTNLAGCNKVWGGVELYNTTNAVNTSVPQNGNIMNIESGSNFSTISNAEIGIKAGRYLSNQFPRGAGILKINNFKFVNNSISIMLWGGDYSTSIFKNCKFEWNQNILFTPHVLSGHSQILIDRAVKVRITDADFANKLAQNAIAYQTRGNGITARNANNISVQRSAFEGYVNGIALKNVQYLNEVAGCRFKNNDYGINAVSVDNLNVYPIRYTNAPATQSIFEVPARSNRDAAGIWVENASGLTITENQFTGAAASACNGGHCSYGIVADNSGKAGGTIRLNNFQGTHFGLQTEGRNPMLGIGCNVFEANTARHRDHAWATLARAETRTFCLPFPFQKCFTLNTFTGELMRQGHPDCGIDQYHSYLAAGNRWMTNNSTSPNCSGQYQRDIYVDKPIIFEYHHAFRDLQQTRKVIPDCATSWWKNGYLKPCNFEVENSNGCFPRPLTMVTNDSASIPVPDWDVIADWQQSHETHIQRSIQLQSTIDSLKSFLDGGSIAALLDSLTALRLNNLPKMDTVLRRNSPLSDEMLQAVLISNAYLSPVAYFGNQLRDLLIANSPLGSKVLQVMLEADSVLDDNRRDSVLKVNANIFDATYDTLRMAYTDLLALLNAEKAEIKITEVDLRSGFAMIDALDTTGTSNYLEAYLRSNHTQASKKQLAGVLWHKGDTAAFTAILDTIVLLGEPEDSIETAWNLEYLHLLQDIGLPDSTGALQLDSLQSARLFTLAESNSSTAPKAHALIESIDTLRYNYVIEKIQNYSYKKDANDNTEPFKVESGSITVSNEKISFNLYPNPNNGRMTLEYEMWEDGTNFQLFDISGKVISTIGLQKGNHTITIGENSINNGVYLFNIRNNTNNLFNGRIIVIK